jgi:hypothetical protein
MRPGATLPKRRSRAAHLMTLDTALSAPPRPRGCSRQPQAAPSPGRANPSNKALPCLPTSFGQQVESDSQFFENLDSIKLRPALIHLWLRPLASGRCTAKSDHPLASCARKRPDLHQSSSAAVAARKRATVPSREWLDFEGDVISSLFAQTESALARRWRSRHENGYHKSDG